MLLGNAQGYEILLYLLVVALKDGFDALLKYCPQSYPFVRFLWSLSVAFWVGLVRC